MSKNTWSENPNLATILSVGFTLVILLKMCIRDRFAGEKSVLAFPAHFLRLILAFHKFKFVWASAPNERGRLTMKCLVSRRAWRPYFPKREALISFYAILEAITKFGGIIDKFWKLRLLENTLKDQLAFVIATNHPQVMIFFESLIQTQYSKPTKNNEAEPPTQSFQTTHDNERQSKPT